MTKPLRATSIRARLIAFARTILRLPRARKQSEIIETATPAEDMVEMKKWANATELKPPE